ncbi:MAG: hypothetical protein KAV00_16290, partial [Phycisphaerae bacterium]|nr:hypothetical protein [Phycisphaerae bacterium]
IHGADAVRQALDRVGDGAERVDAATEKVGATSQRAAGPVAEFTSELRGAIATQVGIEKLAEAFQLIKQDLLETAQAAKDFAASFRDLQFLSQEFDPRARDFVAASAKVGGRGMSESAEAFAQLKSKLPELDSNAQMQAFLEIQELGRTTAAPLGSLVTAYASIANVTGETSSATIQNIIAKSKELAPETDMGAIGESIAEPLAAGQAAGLSTAETLGLTMVIAKKVGDQRKGATAARNFILALAGRGTPEGEKTLRRAGVTKGAGVLGTLTELNQAYSEGKLDTADMEVLFGREAIAGGLGAITGVERVQDFIAQYQQAVRGDRDITAEAINKQLAGDEVTRLTFAIASTDAQIEKEKTTGAPAADALAMELQRKRLELSSRSRGESAAKRAVKQRLLTSGQVVGMTSLMVLEEDVSGYTIDKTVDAVRQGDVTFDAQRGGLRINVVNIGTAYLDNMPDRHSPPYADVGD